VQKKKFLTASIDFMRAVSIVVFKMLHPLCKAHKFLMYTKGAKHAVHSYVLLITGDYVNENHPKAALIACLLF